MEPSNDHHLIVNVIPKSFLVVGLSSFTNRIFPDFYFGHIDKENAGLNFKFFFTNLRKKEHQSINLILNSKKLREKYYSNINF